MKNEFYFFLSAGILFVSGVGSLMHFTYQWSHKNQFVGLFAPVSESIWEHIKLLFFPMLLYTFLATAKLEGSFPQIVPSMHAGLIVGSIAMPVIFYTYSGVLGFHNLFLDILTFLASVLVAFAVAYWLTWNGGAMGYGRELMTAVFIIAAAFFLFSYYPPKLGIFEDPTASHNEEKQAK